MSIGKNIAKFRKMKGFTQAELGELLDVSNQAVSKWESEMTMPDIMLLPELASVLGVSMEMLYDTSPADDVQTELCEAVKKKERKILNISYRDEKIDAKVKIPVEALKAALKLGMTDEEDSKEIAPFIEFLENNMNIDADIPEGHATVKVEDYEN